MSDEHTSQDGSDGDEKKVQRRAAARMGRRLTVDHHLISDVIHDANRPNSSMSVKCSAQRHPAQDLQTPGAVVSVWGSATDEQDHFAPYFSTKRINFDGELGRMRHRLGVASHRGHKPDQPNQDEFFVLGRENSVLFGVLDGHGPDGHDVAHFAQEHLPMLVTEGLRHETESWESSVSSAVARLCDKAREEPDMASKAEISGCTISLLMLDRPEGKDLGKLRLRCAHLGDSMAVLATRKSSADGWVVTPLMQIHRPDREDEAERIRSIGGTVIDGEDGQPGRLAAGGWSLAVSRSFGDFHAVPHGLSHEAEFNVDLDLSAEDENFILVCSDGVWDVMTEQQVVNVVGKYKPNEAQTAVEKLISKAQLRWQETSDVVDDITAVLLWPCFGLGLEPVTENHQGEEQTPPE